MRLAGQPCALRGVDSPLRVPSTGRNLGACCPVPAVASVVDVPEWNSSQPNPGSSKDTGPTCREGPLASWASARCRVLATGRSASRNRAAGRCTDRARVERCLPKGRQDHEAQGHRAVPPARLRVAHGRRTPFQGVVSYHGRGWLTRLHGPGRTAPGPRQFIGSQALKGYVREFGSGADWLPRLRLDGRRHGERAIHGRRQTRGVTTKMRCERPWSRTTAAGLPRRLLHCRYAQACCKPPSGPARSSRG